MGVSCMSSSGSCYDKEPSPTIINPYKFRVLGIDTVYRPLCILHVKYECSSFDGHKLAVYNNLNIEEDIINRNVLDPHFSKEHPDISPIARFRPDKEGLRMAKMLCRDLYTGLSIQELKSDPKHLVHEIKSRGDWGIPSIDGRKLP